MIKALRRAGVTLALTLGFASFAFAQFGAEPAKLDLVKVRDDIYVIHNDVVPGNITVLVTDEGVLLVDTKYALDYENVERMLRSVTDQPIVYVVNTHFHDDHSGANALFQGMDAHVIAHEKARRKMVQSGRSEGLPNVTVDDHARIYIGDTVADLYYFGRAHTDGDIMVHFPQQRVLATGDMFAYGPETPELVDYAGGGSAREWPYSLAKALPLEFDTVVPGHGVVVGRAELEEFYHDTMRLSELTHSMLQQKKSRADIEAMLRREFSFADFHIERSLDGLLVELE